MTTSNETKPAKKQSRPTEHQSPRDDLFHYWIGLVMPSAKDTLETAPEKFLGAQAWVTGRTIDPLPEGSPEGTPPPQRHNVACVVAAPDPSSAFTFLAAVWDLTPENVELRFAWQMPCNWWPSPALRHPTGEKSTETPESLAELGANLADRAATIFVNAGR